MLLLHIAIPLPQARGSYPHALHERGGFGSLRLYISELGSYSLAGPFKTLVTAYLSPSKELLPKCASLPFLFRRLHSGNTASKMVAFDHKTQMPPTPSQELLFLHQLSETLPLQATKLFQLPRDSKVQHVRE